MALKSRTNFPPQGFLFYQAETGWSSTAHIGFEPTVMEIITHRKANPRFNLPTDHATVAATLDAYTEARLVSQYGAQAEQWIAGPPSTAAPSFPWPTLRPRQGVGDAAAGGKTKSGIGTILSWLGSGLRPTDQATATKRAEICSTCENNVRLEGLQKALGTAGEFLHAVVSAKSDLKLATIHDGKLLQCSACSCHLPIKVWVPAEHIKSGMTPEVEAALSIQCWIRPLLK